MAVVLKIRGMYATALTRFFLDQGFQVALPSRPMAERFGALPGFDVLQAPDVDIRDLDSQQGILFKGEGEADGGFVVAGFKDHIIPADFSNRHSIYGLAEQHLRAVNQGKRTCSVA